MTRSLDETAQSGFPKNFDGLLFLERALLSMGVDYSRGSSNLERELFFHMLKRC